MAENAIARRPSFGIAQDKLHEAPREMKSLYTAPTTFATPKASHARGVVGVSVFPDVHWWLF